MLRSHVLALPGAKPTLRTLYGHQRASLALLPARARKQTEKKDVDMDVTDLAADTLPTDLEHLSKLAKNELQHHLEIRGLDKNGNKVELASRLLDNLVNQESVLNTNLPDRVKLEQQLEQPAAATRRGKRTSRKATASADPQASAGSPQAADPVVAAASAAALTAEPATEQAATNSRRGRRTSRKATTSSDPLPSPAEMVAAAAEVAEGKQARRGRKTSRKATSSADPVDMPTSQAITGPEASAAVATDIPSTTSRRARRSKTSTADPVPVVESSAAEVVAAPAKAGRGRRASRKSSVVEPEPAADFAPSTPTADADEAPATARTRGRRSSKTASQEPMPAADQPPAAASPALSRAKLLAQQLAKKEIATHGMSAASASASAAAAAAPGSSWVVGDADLSAAGSQAQSDNLVMDLGDYGMQAVGADSTFSMDNGSVDEVMAQLSAERAAGLSDEPQLRPEAANLSSSTSATVLPQAQAVVADGLALADIAAAADTPPQQYMQSLVESPAAADAAAALSDDTLSAFDHMTLPPSAGAADAAATWPTMPAQQKQDAQVVDTQHPSLADCVAAVEEPLTASADAVEEDEEPDDVMAAFDHTALDSAAAAAVASGNQSPSLADIALAVEPSVLPASVTEGSLGEDEEPDVVLAAFDHMAPEPTAAASAVAVPAAAEEAASGYDQTFLDPVQPSAFGASVGSGSMDLADSEAEPVAPAPQAPKVAVTAGAGAAVKQQRKQGGSQGDVGAIMQRWWASVLMMFDEWQKNLSGRK